MAKLTEAQFESVLQLIEKGDEDESILAELEGMGQEDANFIIQGMGGGGEIAPKKEFTPKPIEYNLDDSQELAQAISQKEGVPFQEAQERVAGFPRREKAFMKGDKFPIVSTIFDVASAPMRGLSGLASSLTSDVSPMERMSRTQAPKGEGVLGVADEFGQNILTDPLTPISGGLSGLVRGGIKQYAPKLGNIGVGALEGLGMGSAEFGAEQLKRAETGEEAQGLSDYAMQAGGGALLGGIGGKIGDVIQGRKEIAESPNILRKAEQAEKVRPDDNIELDYSGEGLDEIKEADIVDVAFKNPKQYKERIIKDVMDGTGFTKKEAESVPSYARGMFANIDEQGKKDLNKYIMQAEVANSGDRNAMTPIEQVGMMFVDGKNAIDKARSQAGKTMGEVENKYLSKNLEYSAPLDGYVQVTHGSKDPNFDGKIRRSKYNEPFDGIFASYGDNTEYGGVKNISYDVKNDKIASMGDTDFDYEKSVEFLKKEYPDADDDTIEEMYEVVFEDANIFEREVNPFEEFGYEDLGEASWQAQNLRGLGAVDQGFDAVEVSDEFGTSILIPYGSKAKESKKTKGGINTKPFKDKWADLMAEYGGMVREVAEDGKVNYKSTDNKKMVPPSMRKDFQEIDDEINELGDFVTGEYLRSVEQNMSEIMRSGSGVSTRMGKMNTKADVATNKMIKMGRSLVGDQIEAKGGKEARDLYNNARKDYAKYWNAQDFIQRRLGKGIADEETGEVATRGGSMVQAMLNNNQDRNTKTLARMINNLTGEDIGKHATMAKFAMQSIGDKRGGAGGSLLKSKGEYLSKAIDWGVGKVTNKGFGKDFEGMTSMVSQAQPNKQRSFLDLIQDNPVTKFGADALQNFGQPALRSGLRGLGGNNEQ